MKKSMFLAMVLSGTVAAQAADYQYLNIEKTDGTTQSLTALGLNITYSGTALTAKNGTEQTTIALTDLKRMFFSNTKAEGGATGIEATAADWDDAETEIYDLRGHRLPQGTKPARGLYIFKKGNTTTKKIVK